jgi:hypothetical protein
MNPFPIAGLKQSGPLALVRAPGATGLCLRSLLRSLADNRLNLAMLAWQQGPDPEMGLCFCVEQMWGGAALALAQEKAHTHNLPQPSLLNHLTAITTYPLGRNLKLPSLLFSALNQAGLSPLAMATSLSAVVTLLAAEDLGPALQTMRGAFDLPPCVSPPSAGIKVVQIDSDSHGAALAEPVSDETVAVYSERPVSCYGLKAEQGLELWQARPKAREWAASALALTGCEPSPGLSFMSVYWLNDSCSLSICLPPDQASLLAEASALSGTGPRPVNLIHLQGPHFGDRPGIAAQALQGLDEAEVDPLAISGVVHSLFLAVEPQNAQAALSGLACRFCGPKR